MALKEPNITVSMLHGHNPAEVICVLPLGATEQHGPHLSNRTDSLIAGAVAEKLREACGDTVPLVILPVEEIGYSPEHLDFPNSESLGWQEAISRWISIGEKLAILGVRKLLLLNAHGGNSPIMTIVATELRVRHSMLCVASSWTRFGWPAGIIDDDEKAYGIHAGDIETSVMLDIASDMVDMSQAKNFPNAQLDMAANNTYLRAYGKHAMGWKMQDLNEEGAVGNASLATPQKGRVLLNHAVDGLVALVDDMHKFDMAAIDHADSKTIKRD